MGIFELAEALGFKPFRQDHLVAWIQCPWCDGRMSLALTYDRFVCHDCDQSGSWLFLIDGFDYHVGHAERVRNWERFEQEHRGTPARKTTPASG